MAGFRFTAGRSYHRYHACNEHDNELFTVLKRTQSYVTLRDVEGNVYRRKIYTYESFADGESYEMAVISECVHVTARDEVKEISDDVETTSVKEEIKEVITMAKITKGQAVAAIQTADTLEAIEAVLMPCTKAVMVEAGTEVLGRELKISASQKKADVAHFIASLIVKQRNDDEFKAKPYDEKCEILMNTSMHCKRISQLCLYSKAELKETAQRLSVFAEGLTHGELLNRIAQELRILELVHRVEEAVASGDKDEMEATLKDMLGFSVSERALDHLIEQTGLNIEADAIGYEKAEALYEHYTQMQEDAVSETATTTDAQESPQAINELEEDCAYVPDWQENSAVLDDVPETSEREEQSEEAAYTSPRKEIVGSVEWYKARAEQISAELRAYEKNRLARHEESYRAKIKQITPSKQLKSIRPESGVLNREDKEVIRENIAVLYELTSGDEMMAALNAVNKITVVSMVYATQYRWLRIGEGFRWEDAQDRPEYCPKWWLINEYVLFVLRDLSSKAHHEYMTELTEYEKWRPETPEEYERRQKKEAILARAHAVYAASITGRKTPVSDCGVEYEPEFEEECYVPDRQSNSAVLDDEPEPRAPVDHESCKQSKPESGAPCAESDTQTEKPQRGRMRVRLERMSLTALKSKSKAVFRKICASERQSVRVSSDRFLVALIRSYHAIEEVIRLKRAPAYSPAAEEKNPPERKCIA